jgi:GDP-L-fucose synthase
MSVLITGGSGMVGRAVLAKAHARALPVLAPRRTELDLLDKASVDGWFARNRVDAVVHLAAKVGGIQANIRAPLDFYLENTLINTHLIDGAYRAGVPRLIYLGSSCMYPRDRDGTLAEADILTGPLEQTNEGYAIAKISGAKHCEYLARQANVQYRTLIPPNLYGPHDNFTPERSHLVPAIIAKLVKAHRDGSNCVDIWGDGEVRREFLFVDDLADYIVDLLIGGRDIPQYLNVGLGRDYSVNAYYEAAAKVVGYTGGFVHNLSRPVGMRRKLLDMSLASQHGWRPRTSLEDGLRQTLAFYLETLSS